MHNIEKNLRCIGWELFYPETMTRILFFKNLIREYYGEDVIPDADLDKCLAFVFGMYGQTHVYSIYVTYLSNICEGESFSQIFGAFVSAFSEALGAEKVAHIQPRQYIDLFFEYLYSRVIKSTPHEPGSLLRYFSS